VPASPGVGMHQPQHLTLPPPHQMVSVQHAPPGVSRCVSYHSQLRCGPSLIAPLPAQAARLLAVHWYGVCVNVLCQNVHPLCRTGVRELRAGVAGSHARHGVGAAAQPDARRPPLRLAPPESQLRVLRGGARAARVPARAAGARQRRQRRHRGHAARSEQQPAQRPPAAADGAAQQDQQLGQQRRRPQLGRGVRGGDRRRPAPPRESSQCCGASGAHSPMPACEDLCGQHRSCPSAGWGSRLRTAATRPWRRPKAVESLRTPFRGGSVGRAVECASSASSAPQLIDSLDGDRFWSDSTRIAAEL